MRCPKCGYNSFDHLDSCKKCGKNLTEHKSKFGIKSLLLSGVSIGAEEIVKAVATEEVIAPVVAPEPEESAPEVVAEQPADEADSDDLGFDFMDDSEEDEDLPFDELFEESSLEDDVDETLPAPDKAEETAGGFMDDPSAFDLGDPGETEADFSAETDLGLEEGDTLEEEFSTDTDLGLDETDMVSFDDDDDLGTGEDPDRPFDCKEALQSEESPITVSTDIPDEPAEEPPADLQAEQDLFLDDPFILDEGDQEDLFTDGGELPPLSSTTGEEPQLESLEASFGRGSLDDPPAGTSDSFTLGALPATDLPDSQKNESSAVPEVSEAVEGAELPFEEEDICEETAGNTPPYGRRIGAFFCDILLLGLVGFCFVIVAETALSNNTASIFPSPKTLIDLSIPYFLVVFCLTFGYFTLFHFLAGQTPGKMVTRIRVEAISGESLSFSQAFMRSVGGLIQTLPAGLGYLSVLLNKNGYGWNDRLAGTRMVDLKKEVGHGEDI